MIVTDDQIREEILQTIRGNRVMLFMKGTPDFPRCGFSARTVQCLNESGAEFCGNCGNPRDEGVPPLLGAGTALPPGRG